MRLRDGCLKPEGAMSGQSANPGKHEAGTDSTG